MSSLPRVSILAVVFLGLGFCVGWWGRGWFMPVSASAPALEQVVTGKKPEPKSQVSAPPAKPEMEVSLQAHDIKPDRMSVIRWLRDGGVPVRVQPFSGAQMSREIIQLLALTPSEVATINSALGKAKVELDNARRDTARSSLSDDGKMLVVEVPALQPEASGPIYDGILDVLRRTLGPERFAMFNELAGQGLDASFDSFGLNHVRYELTLTPRFIAGNSTPYFEYKRHYIAADGTGKGWSSGTGDAKGIEKADPILAHFFSVKTQVTPVK